VTSNIQLTMSPGHWLALGLLSVLWGGSFFFVEIAIAELPTLTLVTVRVGLAALVLHALLIARGTPVRVSLELWGLFGVMALLNNVLPFAALVWSQQSLTAGMASILNATTPLFGLLVAHALTRDEPLSGPRLTGVCIGFVGVALLFAPELTGAGTGAGLLPMLACIGAAVSYSFAGVFGRRFGARGLDPVVVAAGQLTASTVVLAPIAAWLEMPWALPAPGASTIAATSALAIASTAGAYVIYFRLLAAVGAGNLLFVTQLVPVSAILLGVLILGEQISTTALGAMALIAGGLAFTDPRVSGRLLTRRTD